MKNRSLQILKRTILAGFTGFYRNKTVSISSIAILTTTLMIIGVFFFFRGVFDYTLTEIKNKVDIKIYFKTTASQSDIENIKDKLISMPQVKSVNFTSREAALEEFKDKHKDDATTLAALEEVGVNPFGASMSVIAQNTTDYEIIANSLDRDSTFLSNGNSVIEKVNYVDIKHSIEKLNNIIGFINMLGVWISVLFGLMSSMIIYNTVRLAIFVFREEISVMRLVGASNMFIRGPFLIESIIYALLSSVLAMILFFPITYYFSGKTVLFFSGLDIHAYYISHFFSLFLLLLASSILLSIVSSFLAIRKYLHL